MRTFSLIVAIVFFLLSAFLTVIGYAFYDQSVASLGTAMLPAFVCLAVSLFSAWYWYRLKAGQ